MRNLLEINTQIPGIARFMSGMKHNTFFRVMFCYVLCQQIFSSVILCYVM